MIEEYDEIDFDNARPQVRNSISKVYEKIEGVKPKNDEDVDIGEAYISGVVVKTHIDKDLQYFFIVIDDGRAEDALKTIENDFNITIDIIKPRKFP